MAAGDALRSSAVALLENARVIDVSDRAARLRDVGRRVGLIWPCAGFDRLVASLPADVRRSSVPGSRQLVE